MKIINIEAWPLSMRLQEPYTIAYETISEAINIFIRMETNNGFVGYGCAAPDMEITGETPDSVLSAINDVASPLLQGSDPLRYIQLIEKLGSNMNAQYSALAALDMALYDILGKAAGLPVWKLLGGYRDHIKTSVTIGILPEVETLNKANDWIARGFKTLKLKGGLDYLHDIERVLKVREAVGNDIELRFDANQGFTLEQTLKFVEGTKTVNLEFIEQPTPKKDLDLLGRVTQAVTIPIMADESLLTLNDAMHLARYDVVDLINIKLMKVGGINEALHINSVARAAKIQAMVGCMDESALSIAAGLHFTLARSNVIYADLDGHLDLLDDPAATSVIIKDGILYPTNEPGLGCHFRE